MSEKTTLLQGEVENLEVSTVLSRLFRKSISSCISSKTGRKTEDWLLKSRKTSPVPTIGATRSMALMFLSICTSN